MFLTEAHRRVLGNLSIPRSLMELTRQIAGDPEAPFDKNVPLAETANTVNAVLGQIIAEGCAKSVGVFGMPQEVVEAVNDDADVPSLHPEKAAQFIDRLIGKDHYKLLEGELFYWTTAGYETLTS